MDDSASEGRKTVWVSMVDPEIVKQLRALHPLGWGSKRIAQKAIDVPLRMLQRALAPRRRAYLDFLDQILSEETDAKQKKRVAMGIQIAHFPSVKSLDDFDFKFQPSVDHKLVRELATGRFVANAVNVLRFGPPGVGKTHLAIA